MNKYTLLTSAIAILSMNTMNANAIVLESAGADMRTTIHARATMITSLEIEETKVLDFGGIISPQAGDVVVVKSDGTLGAATTANVLTSAYQVRVGSNSPTSQGGISNGQITINGNYLDSLKAPTASGTSMDSYSFTFPEEITLYANEGAATCGVVTDIANDTSNSSDSPSLNYGGKLTVGANIANYLTPNSTLDCEGSGTVTVIYSFE